jgi:tetratricopeptide (TPR) repeat protein
MSDITQLLREGIQAIKAGQPEQGRALLMEVIALAGAFIWLLSGLLTAMEEIGTIGFFLLSSEEPSLLIGMFVFIVLLIALFLNAYTIYMAGGDFKRIPVRHIATVNERIKDPGLLDRIAQRLAQEEQWASAVLYWQHAVGRASGHAPYLLRLGHAYAELGFYERSIDILKTALEKVRSPEVRQEVEEELARVAQLWRAQESPAA